MPSGKYLYQYRSEILNITEDYKNTEYIIFLSRDDEFINFENAKAYYGNLPNVKFVEFHDKGHFHTAAQVFELPELCRYI